MIRRLLERLKPYKKRLAIGYAMMLGFIALRLATPYFSKILVDDVLNAGKYEEPEQKLLLSILVILLLFSVLRAIFVYFRSVLLENVSMSIIYDIRVGLFEHLHKLSSSFYDEHKVGEIMSRMTSDLEAVREFLAIGIIQIVESLIYFAGSITIIFTMSPILGVILLIVTPFIAWIGYKFQKTIHPAFVDIREQNAVLSSRTQENVSGVRVVKAFASEEHEKELFDIENKKQMNFGIRVTSIFSNYHPLLDLITSLVPALLLLTGGYLAIKATSTSVTTGTLVAVFGYIWMVTMPMRELGNLLNMVTQTSASTERLFYYLDLGSSIKEKPGAQFPEKFEGHVRFENVTFSYGDEVVLDDISFDVPAGNTIAIMGATGSGKTSIASLLGRFYECQQGRVLIDGIDVKDYKLKNLRKQIGFVMQDTFLFSDTIAGNIAYGNPDASLEQVKLAARISQAEEFINEIENGYDLVVGERGSGLSGGQKQRIAIARALLIDPKILVLDDATCAVDMETEHAIQKGLRDVMKQRTTFIISHRISAVQHADEIIVLENGQIAEHGRHSELLAKKGPYYKIFMDQYKDYLEITGREVV